MTLWHTVARNIFSNWVALLINIITSFFLAPFVVNSLGDTYYGIWAVLMQFTGYLYLMDFGVRESVIRNTSKLNARNQSRRLHRVLSVAVLIYFAMSVTCMLLVGILTWVFPYVIEVPSHTIADARAVVLLSGAAIAITFLFNGFSGVLMGLQRYYVHNVINVVGTLARAGAIVLVLGAGHKIIGLALLHSIHALIVGLLVTVFAIKALKQGKLGIAFVWVGGRAFVKLAGRLFNYSFFVFINNIGQKLVFATDALIIGIFMPVAAVTQYAIAGNLINYLKNLVAVTAEVLSPLTSHYHASGENARVAAVMVQGSRLSLFVALPVVTTYLVVGHEFIGLWMGERYAQSAGEVLFVLAIAQAVAIPSHTISSVLYGLSQHRTLAYARLVEAACNIGLSIVLVQRYGVIGVAFGTMIPHLAMSLLYLPWYAARKVNIPLQRYLILGWLPPILNLIPFTLLMALWFRLSVPEGLLEFFVRIGLLCLVYILTAPFIVLTRSERRLVADKIRSRFPQKAKS